MKISSIVILAAIAIFAVALGVNFAGNTSLYTVFPAAKKSGDNVHIVGQWVDREQASYDNTRDLFRFVLQDTLGNKAWVEYNDPQPQNFEQAERVVVIGQYKDNAFHADKIVMKCPSKYEETEVK